MFNFKKFFLCLSFVFLPFSLSAEILDCTFDEYNQSSYPMKMKKSWVPEKQKIKIENDIVKLWSFSAPLKKSGIKYKWALDVSTEKTDVVLKYVFFTSNNKIAVDVDFKKYLDIKSIWGKCIRN